MDETKLEHYLKACVPLIYVRTSEDNRAVHYIRDAAKNVNLEDCWIGEWTANNGLIVDGEKTETNTVSDALKYLTGSKDNGILIIHNIRQFISNFLVIQDLKDAAMTCRLRGSYIILVGAEVEFPPEIRDLVTIYDFNLPDKEFFVSMFIDMINKYKSSITLPDNEEEKTALIEKASDAALGMTQIQGENAMALSIVKTKSIDISVIYSEKEQAIKQSDVLELVRFNEDQTSLGGFDVFKTWLSKRVNAFSKEAIEYGLKFPRGILLCGIPGCVSGDTILTIRRGNRKGGRKYTIRNAYFKFNSIPIEDEKNTFWDDNIPTYTLAYKDNNRIGFHEILSIYDSGDKMTYTLTTDKGNSIRVTDEHPFLTPDRGFVELQDLKTGDEIIGRNLNMKKGGKRKQLGRKIVETLKYYPNGSMHKVNGYSYKRTNYARLVVEADMNNLSTDSFIKILKEDPEYARTLKYLDADLIVHHKDRDFTNDGIHNLEIMTKIEHDILHGYDLSLNFGNQNSQTEKVESIVPFGIERTYDVAMTDPYRNFVANNLVVHNTGKSQCAKAISSVLGVPLIRFDVGKVFRSLQGSSESAVRQALKVAEAVAPAVIWTDELEKSMAGTESSGKTDSGTTARVMQTILTWMQEKQSPIFVAATVNNVDALPPELLRKGRFDEVFGVDLPVFEERREIFSIHISKRNRDPNNYDLDAIAKSAEKCTGAEIEETINDAMATAFSDGGREFTTDDILSSINDTIPQAVSQREKMTKIRDWIGSRTRLVSSRRAPKWDTSAAKEVLNETRKVRGGKNDGKRK